TPAGRQPMASPSGDVWVTFNGEIYNFLELRRELEGRGHQFRSRSDTEVLLAAYREYGIDCLEKLRGMFAFAIWDEPRRRLFIARDRAGKKPLHYFLDQDGIAFASEPKAFLADPGFEARPSLAALAEYMTYQYVPSPMSAFEGVAKLPPAHYLVVENGNVTVNRYWKLSYAQKRKLSDDEACEALIAELREAVRLRMISDVPLGAFLSGGVDSSLIVALMAEQTSRVKTFSIGFEESEFDELPYARLVAERYATEHCEMVVRPDVTELLPKLVWHYNEPFADASAIPTYCVSQMTREHVTVALNGDAGDENFGGYRRYLTDTAAQRFDSLPPGVRNSVAAVADRIPVHGRTRSFPNRTARWLKRLSEPAAQRYARRIMHFQPEVQSEVCMPAFLDALGDRAAFDVLRNTSQTSDAHDDIDAMLDLDVNHYLPDCLLVKVDIASMAHGLEARSPMLDHVFMEFAARLPSHMKVRGLVTKYILKRAAIPFLPQDNIYRTKRGFSIPLAPWFRGEFGDYARDVLLDGRLAQRGYFKMDVVRRLLEEHRHGVNTWQKELWNLLMLELWHRMFIDRRPREWMSASSPATASLEPVR
ncbi:MAG TPA: asparagine synthase (glutamine-hydrolyzing), partial [Vicinamibacterales bacterium]|nr:asparagine synthase (glutamine-hydrolyzing) [Vicinamibacterales bacterium]